MWAWVGKRHAQIHHYKAELGSFATPSNAEGFPSNNILEHRFTSETLTILIVDQGPALIIHIIRVLPHVNYLSKYGDGI